MNVNLFAWIREGVKQAVLLGVSDAVESLGTPAQGDDIEQRLLSALRQGQADDVKRDDQALRHPSSAEASRERAAGHRRFRAGRGSRRDRRPYRAFLSFVKTRSYFSSTISQRLATSRR